jgi:hypothetical protein
MARLVWRKGLEGYDSDGYRVRPLLDPSDRTWRLESSVRAVAPVGATVWLPVSRHRTLRGARARAELIEAERARRLRTRLRVALGAAAMLAFFVAASLSTNLVGYAAAMVSFGTALHLFGTAAAIRLGDSWDWAEDRYVAEGWIDRVGFAVARSARRRAASLSTGEPSVRVLPPDAASPPH